MFATTGWSQVVYVIPVCWFPNYTNILYNVYTYFYTKYTHILYNYTNILYKYFFTNYTNILYKYFPLAKVQALYLETNLIVLTFNTCETSTKLVKLGKFLNKSLSLPRWVESWQLKGYVTIYIWINVKCCQN